MGGMLASLQNENESTRSLELSTGEIIRQEATPRIVTVNFSEKTTAQLSEKGYDVKSCRVTRNEPINVFLVDSPKPPHEIDILIVKDVAHIHPRPHDKVAMTMTYSGVITWPSGKAQSIKDFCGSILKMGRTCIFLVGEVSGEFLRQTAVGILPDNTHKMWPKASSYRIPTDVPDSLHGFVKRWLNVPAVCSGYRFESQAAAINVDTLLHDESGTSYALVKTIFNGKSKDPGSVHVYPDYGDRPDVLDSLLREAVSKTSPHLFPGFNDTSWQIDPEFVHPRCLALREKGREVKEQAEIQIVEIESEIELINKSEEYLNTLILGEGDQLKDAVRKTLECLFQLAGAGEVPVLDVDSAPQLRNGSTAKREDLRIEWLDKIFLINVTGRGQSLRLSSINQLDEHRRLFIKHNPLSANSVHSILFVNHDYKGSSDPRTRGPIFGSSMLDGLERLKAAGHGICSTFGLYKLIRGSQRGEVSVTKDLLLRVLLTEGVFTLDSESLLGQNLEAPCQTENVIDPAVPCDRPIAE